MCWWSCFRQKACVCVSVGVPEGRAQALGEELAGGCRGGDGDREGERGEAGRASGARQLPLLPPAGGSAWTLSSPSGMVSVHLYPSDTGSHSSGPEPERGLIINTPRVWSAHPQALGDDFCGIHTM